MAVAIGLLATVCAGCGLQPASDEDDVTAGMEIENRLAVVALVDDGQVFCTGTLISPTVVLTAGHCIRPIDRPPPQVFFGGSLENGGELWDAVAVEVHPDFRFSPLAWDLALVHLPGPARVSPLRVLDRELGDWALGEPVRVVGFGLPTGEGGDPLKREGYAVIESIDETTFRVTPSPSQPCRGDSGGPVFLDTEDTVYLIGVVSNGDFSCSRYAELTRVDTEPRDFFDEYLPDDGASQCSAAPFAQGGALLGFILALAIAQCRHGRGRRPPVS